MKGFKKHSLQIYFTLFYSLLHSCWITRVAIPTRSRWKLPTPWWMLGFLEKAPLRIRQQCGSWYSMLMSRRDSPRVGTIWTWPRTAPQYVPWAGSPLWTQTRDKAATSGGYCTLFTLSRSVISLCNVARACFRCPRYSIDPQSDPEALFRIASDTGFISAVMELDREQEQWHNITVIATQRGMSAPNARRRYRQQSSADSYFTESNARSLEYKVGK